MSRHLVHIGYPKTGSTTLTAWFAAHPQLDFAPNGIGGYYHAFDIAAAAAAADGPPPPWQVTSSESLTSPRRSDAATLQDPAVALAGTHVKESRERVCRTLSQICGDATILIVTRGFRSALASNYAQYVRSGGRLAPEELLTPHAEELATFLDYDAVVAMYEQAFGGRVLVLPYELLREDPLAFTGEIERRLGLEPAGLTVPVHNRALSPATLHWTRAMSRVAARAAEPLGPRVGQRAFALYVRQAFRGRLERPAGLLERAFPARTITPTDVPDAVIERCRGRAASVGQLPLHQPYAEAYLTSASA